MITSHMQFTIMIFVYMYLCFKPRAFLLRLNNPSFFCFSSKCLDLNSYMCLVFFFFFAGNIMIS